MARFPASFPWQRLGLFASVSASACALGGVARAKAEQRHDEYKGADAHDREEMLPRNYVVYDAKTGTRLRDMCDVARRAVDVDADCVLVGEVHTNAASHDAELKLLQALHSAKTRRPLSLSMEMFETDVQSAVDAYVAGLATREDLERDARPWGNYDTDYHPLVSFCREHRLRVIAANAPRRVVSFVGKHGAAALEIHEGRAATDLGIKALAPVPLPYVPLSSALREKIARELFHAYGGEEASSSSSPAASTTTGTATAASDGSGGGSVCPHIGWSESDAHHALYDAQALWDASMAAAITSASERSIVMHVCGKFHCEHGLGICERLPDHLKVLVVVCVPWTGGGLMDVATFRRLGLDQLGDFVVLTESLPDE